MPAISTGTESAWLLGGLRQALWSCLACHMHTLIVVGEFCTYSLRLRLLEE
jgi:hypothetical protein